MQLNHSYLIESNSRLRQQCSKRTCQMKRQGGSWVIHIPSRKHNLMQVRPAGQAGYPISLVASLDTVPVKCCVPLHYLKREKREEKRRKFYIYPDVTHTHTRQSRENPERQEEEKSGHTTGRRPKTAQGGRGTDGPPEPTYTAKRT